MLAVERNVTINIPERIRWSIVVWYSVKDLDFDGEWTTGVNYLASVHVHPQTYDEVASQISDLQDQVSNLQNQQYGFIFIALYLTVTLGIAVPMMQKRRKTASPAKTN